MTSTLLPHQQSAVSDPDFGRRQQFYTDKKVHDVKKAMDFLGNSLVGFFVEMPLDWGMDTLVKSDPTKAGFIGIDIAEDAPNPDTEETAG